MCQIKPAKNNENTKIDRPSGGWNSVQLIVYGEKSLHIVNGEMVVALSNSRYVLTDKEMPLTRGKILLQSEVGEFFLKDVRIKPVMGTPNEYAQHCNSIGAWSTTSGPFAI